jgi:putative drug exporter of the RND superfamily
VVGLINVWLRGLAKVKWIVLVLWIACAVGSVFVFPDLKQIVRETEWRFLPQDAASAQAAQILNDMSPDRKSKSNAVIVLNRVGGLTENDQTWLKGKIDELKRDKEALGISSVLSQFEDPSVAEKFVSADKTTEMIVVDLPKNANVAATGDSVALLKDRMQGAPQGAVVSFTGSAPIFLDYSHSSEAGLQKTELLTVILVVVILLIVFRSPIAPFVPLLTIGISYIITRGLVAQFTKYGLPVSTFTETFLIAVMFGAGTDYCILLISRYREELSKTPDRIEALVQTVKSVGKTVVFAGSTVFIAFFLIGFAKFGLYQSAAGVAVGIAVTLLAATTLAPVLMLILGKAMYWPVKAKPGAAHGESKWWGGMNRLVTKRPVAILLVCLLVMTPITLLYQGTRSFDDLGEMDKNTSAVKGFRQVEASFSSGEVLPITAAISTNVSMRTPEGLAALEKASADAAKVANVKEVRSAARPLGKQLAELTVPSQLVQTNKALSEVQSGVSQIGDGLKQAQSELNGKTGDIEKLRSGAAIIADKLKETQLGLGQLAGGLNDSKRGSEQLAGAAGQLEQTAQSMNADLSELAKLHPELAQDPVYLGLVA